MEAGKTLRRRLIGVVVCLALLFGVNTLTSAGAAADESTAPVAVDDAYDIYVGGEGELNVKANDSDPQGDHLTVTAVGTPSSDVVQYGGLSGDDLIYVIVSENAQVGQQVTLTYTVTDGSEEDTATITLTIVPNTQFTAKNDVYPSVYYGTYVFDPRVNDTDPLGRPLTIVSFSQPNGCSCPVGSAKVTRKGDVLQINILHSANGNTLSFLYKVTNGTEQVETAEVVIPVKLLHQPQLKKTGKPKQLLVTNKNAKPMIFRWYPLTGTKKLGKVTINPGRTVKLRVVQRHIKWHAALRVPNLLFVGYGELFNIRQR